MAVSVLIVDDHAGFRAVAREMLETEGFRVVGESADGASAVADAGELRPDVVLLDVQLPDMSGLEVAELLAKAPGPAVVLTSSRDGSELGDRLASGPVRGFIPKAQLSGAALTDLLA